MDARYVVVSVIYEDQRDWWSPPLKLGSPKAPPIAPGTPDPYRPPKSEH
jgi:hypothetical protein